jgi:uncharacterized protein YecE (DUF72 family)
LSTRYLIGTSGWNYPHWRRRFYPPELPAGAWLDFYARRFPTVEINYTFYRLPRAAVFAGWRAAVPGSFTFAVKASRFITHIKRLRAARRSVGLLLGRARPLRGAFGPVLFQLPPTMPFEEARLRVFLAGLPPGRRYAMEFRHESWHRDETYALLRARRVAYCIADSRDRPPHVLRTAPFVYVRFHGAGPRGRYGGARLRRWADRLREAGAGAHTVYVYFNNDWGGYAIEDAARLAELLG